MDIEKLKDIAKQEGVNGLPSFKMYKAGKLLGEGVGTIMVGIEGLIKRHSATPQMEMGVLTVGNSELSQGNDCSQQACRCRILCRRAEFAKRLLQFIWG